MSPVLKEQIPVPDTLCTNTLHYTLGYADPSNGLAFKLNPNKWVLNGEYPHGIVSFQMTINKENKDPQSGPGVFPLTIWFDPNF